MSEFRPGSGLGSRGAGTAREVGARSTLVPVSYVVFTRGDEVLLQRRRGTGYLDGWWATAAAGHVEAGESAGAAAAREVFEELGVVVSPGHLLPLTVMHRAQPDGAAVARVDFFFTCTAWTGTPQIREPDKASDLRWFRLDRLPGLLVPHEHHVLERLRTGLPPIISRGFAAEERAEPGHPDALEQP